MAFLGLERARERVRRGDGLGDALKDVAQERGLHDPHAGAGGQRDLRREPGAALPGRLGPARSAATPTRCWPWARENGSFNLTVLAIRLSSRVQRRQQAPRPGLLGHVAPPVARTRREIAGRSHHQRRPHRELGRARRCARSTPTTCDPAWEHHLLEPEFWARIRPSPTTSCGRPTARRRSA